MRSGLRAGVLALLAASVACTGQGAPPAEVVAAQSSSPTTPPPGKLQLSYDEAVVGADVRASFSGLRPNAAVDLVWQTVTGGWVIEDYYHFRGKKYEETTLSLGTFQT